MDQKTQYSSLDNDGHPVPPRKKEHFLFLAIKMYIETKLT